MEQLMMHTSGAPDERAIIMPEDAALRDLLMAALKGYLRGGATLIKDAARKPRGYRQYRPAGTNPFSPWTSNDFLGSQAAIPTGSYIITIVPEVQSIRYTTDGTVPSSTVGMLLVASQFVDIVLQDLGSLQFCAVVAGAVINMELFQVDA